MFTNIWNFYQLFKFPSSFFSTLSSFLNFTHILIKFSLFPDRSLNRIYSDSFSSYKNEKKSYPVGIFSFGISIFFCMTTTSFRNFSNAAACWAQNSKFVLDLHYIYKKRWITLTKILKKKKVINILKFLKMMEKLWKNFFKDLLEKLEKVWNNR